MGAEGCAHRLQVLYELVVREVLGAIEGHVLDKVGESKLVVVFEDGADPNDETQLSARLGYLVLFDEPAQSIVEGAAADAGVDG